MEEKEKNSDIQSLMIDYIEDKKEEETFETKMDSLFNQLDVQFEKVKRYANIDVPLDQIEIDKYKFKYNYQPENEIINNENLIEYNKDNNDNDENIIIKKEDKKVEIKEIKDDEEIKKKMYDEMAYQRMEEERKIKEIELEKKIEKNKEEEKRIKEEQKKREEELIKKEKEILKREQELKKKEKEIERKREEEEKRIKEERRKREEEEEANEKWRLLKEEEERLKIEEIEKEKEEKRENDRIKELRILREKREKEEKERKKKEEEKKKELEKLKKAQEMREEQKLKEQIKNTNQKMNNKNKEETENNENEIKIDEIDSDDDIEELEEKDNSNTNTHIQQSKNQLIKNNINNEVDNTKLKSGNKNNLSNSKFNKSLNQFNNKSRNRNMSPTKKSQTKESINKNQKKPKEEKKPENDLFQEKKEKNREDSEFAQKFKSSKEYAKLSQEIIDKLLEYIYAIDDFDEKSSENDDVNIYPGITEFDKEEKDIKENIPEFEKKILEKDKLTADDRLRKYYTEEEAFETNQECDKINELLTEIISISEETHMELLQRKYENDYPKNLPKLEDLDDMEELDNKIFEKEDFYPEYNPIISNLENLQTFIYKYRDSAEENPNIMINAYRYFNYWRASLNDGNSFYRVNIFALIEHCILQKDSQFFSYILNEISSDEFIEYYKKRKIEYEKPFMILSAIYLLIQNNLEEKAHEYLLKAYNLKNGCFDILLITYLKKVLINFGKEINELLEEKKKSGENLELIEEAKIDLEQIENFYLDPPKINLFYLISSLFNINIKLFLLGGNFLKPINILKEIKNVETSPTFTFGYFFSGYYILYSPDFDNDNEIFNILIENDNPQLCRLTHQLKENKRCDICFKETEHLVFLKKKFMVCIPCLLDHLKKVIKKRSDYFFEENCLGQEYYSRPIYLQDEFNIDDFDFIELNAESNILNKIFANNKGNKCTDCGKMKSEDVKLIELDCKCNYCHDCLERIILKMTNNFGYLLPCEVEMFNNKFKCKCGKMYTYDDFEKLFNVDEEQKEKAKERLSLYKDNYCLTCLKNLIKDLDMKKVKIKKEKDDDKEHFICNKCYCKHFRKVDLDSDDDEDITKEDNEKEEEKDDNEVKVIKDEHKIKCSICRRWHHYSGDIEGCGCIIL